MEWVASTIHTTSEHGVSSIATADARSSPATNTTVLPRRYTSSLMSTNRGAPEGLQGTGLTTNICDSHSVLAEDSALLGCYNTSNGKHLPTFQRKCLHLQGEAVFFLICFTLKIDFNLRNIQFRHNFCNDPLIYGQPLYTDYSCLDTVIYHNERNQTHVGFSST